MKTLITLATLSLFIMAPHAQESVAQGSVGSGSAAAAQNTALESKIQAVQTQTGTLNGLTSEIKTEQDKERECAAEGKLWNGTACVAPGHGTDGTSTDTLSKLLSCNAKGMFYDPANPTADADGCYCSTACEQQ